MNIEQEIRNEIDNIKQLKIDVGDINSHLSVLEGLCRERNQKAVENAYQRGLDDAWEAARKIVCNEKLDWNTLLHLFNRGNFTGIFGDFSAAEVIEKLKAYEEKQKANEEFKVGDEVRILGTDNKFFIVGYEGDCICGFASGGKTCRVQPVFAQKTGRHINIENILEDMKE